MIDTPSRVTNILSVLLNGDVVEKIGIGVDAQRRPVSIVAFLVEGEEPGLIQTMFAHELGCGYGCPSSGVTVEDAGVVIHRDSITDKESFDVLISTLVSYAN